MLCLHSAHSKFWTPKPTSGHILVMSVARDVGCCKCFLTRWPPWFVLHEDTFIAMFSRLVITPPLRLPWECCEHELGEHWLDWQRLRRLRLELLDLLDLQLLKVPTDSLDSDDVKEVEILWLLSCPSIAAMLLRELLSGDLVSLVGDVGLECILIAGSNAVIMSATLSVSRSLFASVTGTDEKYEDGHSRRMWSVQDQWTWRRHAEEYTKQHEIKHRS